MQSIILLLFMVTFRGIVSLDTEVITTKTGKVQGVVEEASIAGKSVQKFSNIPYAESPVGELRFAKPQPKKPWKVITTKTGNVQGVVEEASIPGKSVQKFSNIPYAESPVGKLRFAKPQPKKPWKVITTKTGNVQGVVEEASIPGKSVQKFSNIPYAESPVGKLRFAKPQPKKPWKVITTKTGKVQGVVEEASIPGKSVQKFSNIPYAESPVGELRFNKPQPKKPWKVITTKTGKVQGVVEEASIPGKSVQTFSNIPYAETPVGKLRFAKPQPKKPWKVITTKTGKVQRVVEEASIPGKGVQKFSYIAYDESPVGTLRFAEPQPTKVITTKTGKVQGVVEEASIPGKSVQKFSNIPYAESPVGKLRFAKPQPKKPWKGTLRTSSEPILCLQHRFFPHDAKLPLTEDCLILNIWTPYPQKENQSVMVWIHGGGYAFGYSSSYPGHNFVAVGDVILVTINYRLSALGFLASGDERIKGNFGLFDQRLAFKWVKENIASFGGDPQSITIFGESAGGSSVSAHTLSKKSWPYFDRAICQSGVLASSWATASEQTVRGTLQLFLETVNCADNENVLECLQNNVTGQDLENLYSPHLPGPAWVGFGPVVDGDFLKDDPKELLKSGQIKNDSMLLGIMKDDAFDRGQNLLQISRNATFFEAELEKELTMYFANSSPAVLDKALELYQPKCVSTYLDAFRAIVNFKSDNLFICDIANEAILRSQMFTSTNIYLYRYSFVTLESPDPFPFEMYPRGTFGFAAHAFDVPSLFGFRLNNYKSLPEEKILSMRMILYWTNFAKNDDPNVGITKLPIVIDKVDDLPKWPKFTNSSREYLDMESLSRMLVGKRLREKYCSFLNDPEGFIEREVKPSSESPRTPTPSSKPSDECHLLRKILIK